MPTENAASDLPILPASPAAQAGSLDPVEPDGINWLVWLSTLLGLILAGIAGLWWYRRSTLDFATVPTIEPPLARSGNGQPPVEPKPAPVPSVAPAPSSPVRMRVEVEKLNRSMMYATLSAKMELTNRGKTPLTNIALEADLVSAHGSIPVEEQLAGAATALEAIEQIEAIAPGKTVELTRDLRLPLAQLRLIRQGKAALYIPLLRLRITAQGIDPIVRTFVIGMQPGEGGGRLQPFRLDETPQTYRAIGARALD